jgi:hypothetical protein
MTSLASEPPRSRLLKNGIGSGCPSVGRHARRDFVSGAVIPTIRDHSCLTVMPRGALDRVTLILIAALLGACAADEPAPAASAATAAVAAKPTNAAPSTTANEPPAPSAPPDSGPPEPPPATDPAPPPKQWGRADTDPENDFEVGPPDPVPDCEDRLRSAGVEFRPAPAIRLRTNAKGEVVCGNEQLVTYVRGPGGIAFKPSPTLSCGLALALARLEEIAQEEAERQLGSRVKRIVHGGTYSCRKMARFKLISEHSYANGIDIYSFVLEDGRQLSVKRHFGGTNPEASGPEARFLRTVARRLFDEDVMSVVVTPFFDRLHHDHVHVDLARYRTDGTRP